MQQLPGDLVAGLPGCAGHENFRFGHGYAPFGEMPSSRPLIERKRGVNFTNNEAKLHN
jgi:hypothetical protein